MIKGFLFDVYGTVCDWHTPMTEAIDSHATSKGMVVDAPEFARQWRRAYAVETARRASSDEPFIPLQVLTLDALTTLAKNGFSAEGRRGGST